MSALMARLEAELVDHDTAEPAAMAHHYAARAGPDLPHPDPLTRGLFAGFHAHRRKGGREA